MRWLVKAAAQRGLSVLPRADAANYWFQRHVTHGLPRSDDSFLVHARETLVHLRAFEEHGSVPAGDAHFYEFGAGWDLVTPLLFRALGVRAQTLIDIRANVRFDAVAETLAQIDRHRAQVESEAGRPLERLPAIGSLDDLERLGIVYLAPRDARDTRLQAESFDFASSTFTLEHIPAKDIAPILAESARLLRGEGVMSHSIDMEDHYSFFDSSVSPYNFLRYGERRWAVANSPLHYQNRLRLPDYLALFERPGLELLEVRREDPGDEDRRELAGLDLAPRFRGYDVNELGVRGAVVVARRPA